MAQFTDANLQSQYNSILSGMQGTGAYTPLSMPEQTLDSITEQLVQTLRPQYERAIAERFGATKQQKAAVDVDAASRGMGTSTWVTDAKNRLKANEAADVAGLESDYAAQLAGDALTQYNNYLSNKLQLEQYNQQLQAALEGEAYDRAMSQYSNGLIEGTIPYQQLMFQWEQTQKAAKSSGKTKVPSMEETAAAYEEYLRQKENGSDIPPIQKNRTAQKPRTGGSGYGKTLMQLSE